MLTPSQYKTCEFIKSYIEEHGYSPSFTEIAEGIGISPKSVSLISRNIHALVAVGKLKFSKTGYRNLEVVETQHASSMVSLPLLGRIAAGSPIEAIEDKKSIDLSSIFSNPNLFALAVRGDSMVEEGILDGDIVVCRQAQRAQEGDIVVALIDGQEATLKKLSYQVPERVTLIPANVNLKPKAYLPGRVQVQGVYVGLLRLTV